MVIHKGRIGRRIRVLTCGEKNSVEEPSTAANLLLRLVDAAVVTYNHEFATTILLRAP